MPLCHSVSNHKPAGLRVRRYTLRRHCLPSLVKGRRCRRRRRLFPRHPRPPLPKLAVVPVARHEAGEPGAEEETDEVENRGHGEDGRQDALHLDARQPHVGEDAVAEEGEGGGDERGAALWRRDGALAGELIVGLLRDVHEAEEPSRGLVAVQRELCAVRDGEVKQAEVEGVTAKCKEAAQESDGGEKHRDDLQERVGR